jgi:Ig-like domain-containing protein
MQNLRIKKIREKLIFSLVIFAFIFSSNLKAQNPFDIISNTLDNATFVSSNLPTSLQAGQTYSASITFRNSGLHTWGTNEPYKLALHDVNDNAYQTDVWGVRTVSLPNDVRRDDRVTFNFDIRAPYQSGVYNLRWSMMKDNSFFGESTPSLLVNISGDENVQLYSNIRTGGAQFINQSVPSTMVAGQKYRVLITIKNTGSSTWYPSSYGSNNGDYKLAAVSGSSYTNWGVSPVYLTRPVAPGITETFEVEVVAPSTQGTYDFQWQMMQGNSYFGEKTASVMVDVTGSYYNQPPPNNYNYNRSSSALFVNQSVPSPMTAGETYVVSVTLKNNGSTTWYPSSYGKSYGDYQLAAVNDYNSGANSTDWGVSPVYLTKSVDPGVTGTFEFKVKAPSTPGTYNFQWQVTQDGIAFGEKTRSTLINVVGTGSTNNYYNNNNNPANSASFVSQSVPYSMRTNRSYTVSVTMTNTGNSAWTRGSYYLSYYTDPRLMRVTVNPWGIENIGLPYDVSPGQSAVFTFNVTASSTPGTHDFQWIMNNGGSFGDPSSLVQVSVVKRSINY